MGKFDGKKILILGSNTAAEDIVIYAQSEGAYVYVADYYPAEKSPAKMAADEALAISTDDLETLSNVIKGESIDAVFAGISEFNLLRAMKLAKRCGLPFYCTEDQWKVVEEKDNFRGLCLEHGVPCPRTFFRGSVLSSIPWDEIEYPVVLKPVDSSSSMGVFFCDEEDELRAHLEESAKASHKGAVIVEEYVEGCEFTAHYTITAGEVSFSCIDNRYPVAIHEGNVSTVPIGRVYPCLFIDEYFKQANESVLEMIESLKIDTGVLFVQGIYDKKDNKIVIFEAGLRSAGESPFRFIEQVNGVNYMKGLVEYLLTGRSSFSPAKEDPWLKGMCCGVISFVARGGVVGRIEGIERALAQVSSVIAYESRYPTGSTVPDTDTLKQIMIRFVMVCESREEMERDIAILNRTVTVEDDDGRKMVFKMEPQRIWGLE